MKDIYLRSIPFFVSILLVLAAIFPFPAVAEGPIDENIAKAIMPEADSFKQMSQDGFTYAEALKDGKLVGYCLRCDGRGYNGPIKMLAAITPDGVIKEIKILSHNEIDNFGAAVQKHQFLNQFSGRKAPDVTVTKGIDVVSGATISSKAVIDTVREQVKEFLSHHPLELRKQ